MRTMRMLRWRFKTVFKVVILVFFVSTLIVHYAHEKFQKTSQILKALGSRDVKDVVQPFTDTFLINNHWLNPDTHFPSPDETFLVIAVTSLPGNDARRQIIRSSWMKYKTKRSTIIVFFTGRPNTEDMTKLQKESEKHGDLIVDDFEESYYSLSIKTLRILKWFTMNLPTAKFLVKTDDDVYVNPPALIEHLESTRSESINNKGSLYIGGMVFAGRSPHTLNSFSKWFVPPKLWKDEVAALNKAVAKKAKEESLNDRGTAPEVVDSGTATYPDYVEGNFYVISGKTVPLLLNASLQLPLFHLEDLYVTGLVGSKLLGIKLEEIPKLFTDSAMWPQLNYWWNKRFVQPKNMIAYHCDYDVDIIRQIYEESLKS